MKEELENKIEVTKEELRNEIVTTKEELENKIEVTKEELRNEIAATKQEVQYLKLDLKVKYDDLREAIFYLENNLGGKMDYICDFIKMQTDKNHENSKKFSKVHKKIEKNEFRIFNHEERIKFLEKKLNQANWFIKRIEGIHIVYFDDK